jgi:hypothetical protein
MLSALESNATGGGGGDDTADGPPDCERPSVTEDESEAGASSSSLCTRESSLAKRCWSLTR